MQRRLFATFIFVLGFFISQQAFAILNMELTRGVAGAMPIAIVPFVTDGEILPVDIASVVTNDLQNSGRFKVSDRNSFSERPGTVNEVKFNAWRERGVDNLVLGKVRSLGGDRYQVTFTLLDLFRNKDQGDQQNPVLMQQEFTVSGYSLRAVSHRISDMVYQQLTGVRGIFSTKLAYILVQNQSGKKKYILEVCDQDGANPKPLLISNDPIMSPAWSPNGKQIAYVSFEGKRSSIFVEDIATGTRSKVTSYPGINGAPAWSRDGKRLAFVLSKSGSPNIYVKNLMTGQLQQVTRDWSINTEPAWSPDSKTIIFTSNRGGSPQIYQVNVATGTTQRVTYDGNYNARASFTHDGNHIAMLHQEGSMYNIALLDLDSGRLRTLNNSGEDQSPSIAPNGSMVLFGTLSNGQSVLAMASSDGNVQLLLPSRNGDVQDPAWSPFLL